MKSNDYYHRYTSSKDRQIVYAIVLFWPKWGVLDLGAPQVTSKTHISIIGYDNDVDVSYIVPTNLSLFKLLIQNFVDSIEVGSFAAWNSVDFSPEIGSF